MASSLNQPKSEPGMAAGLGFGLSWRHPKGLGAETVITNPRVMAPGTNGEGSSYGNELVPRLFPATHDAENVSGITIGHFTIQKRIGIGGMGSVFLASDGRLKREVALKVLAPALALDAMSVQRFQNEAQAAARLDHDNIARVFYSGEEFGLHYIAYEYVPGQNLRDLIRAKGWLDPAEAVNYAIQLAAALHHSSSAGVIHRDIKPSNVLITPFGRAKLVDLGLARKTSLESSLELTVPGTTLGTFDYISPEQARDPHSVDVRSDIYSLGCTLYHMLAGEPPYPEGTALQKLLDHHGKEPPDPAKKNRRVSPMLSHVVRKMMASQPGHRYASPPDLLRDLLIVARGLGAGAVPIDGQVWLTATRFKPPFWQDNFGWVATTCALCLIVAGMQFYPKLMQLRTGTNPEPAWDSTAVPGDRNLPARNSTDRRSPDVDRKTQNQNAQSRSSRDDFAPATANTLFESSKTGSSPATSSSANDFPPLIVPIPPDAPVDSPAKPDKPVVAAVEQVAAIRILNGKSYASLEAACTEAADAGSIIELRYNGVREPERPIRFPNKIVTIRAADGFRPTILFAPSESASEGSQPQMMTVAGGLLELVNVDLVMAVPNRTGSDRWALFSLERPEKLHLKGVTVTVTNPHNKAACVIEHRAPVGKGLEGMGLRRNGMPVVPPETLLTKSIVRGVCDFVVMRDPVPARFELKESLIGVEGNLLQLRVVVDAADMEKEGIALQIEHVTCLLGESLLSVETIGGSTDILPPILIDARNNIISCGAARPLIAMRGLSEFMDFQKSFSWKGDANFYDNIATFLEISPSQPNGNNVLDHGRWKKYWGSNEGARSNNSPVVWRTDASARSFPNLTRDSVELSPDSNPAFNGGSDGYAAGPTLKELPLLDK